MLQQTQVSRVVPKFIEFTVKFPDFQRLAEAPQSEVIKAWQGLGYNRRARYLHQTAKVIVDDWKGEISRDQRRLAELPGIGPNTAGAIRTYAFNLPAVFIETNIRTVYLHHFFGDEYDVPDNRILPHIDATLDRENPREFYWSLMDYGAHLKKILPNPSRRSKHHAGQSTFEGSFRQLRARIITLLSREGEQSEETIMKRLNDTRSERALQSLRQEQLIRYKNAKYRL